MPKYQEKNRELEKWIRSRREEGFVITKAKGYAYIINGKKTKIKFAQARRDGTFWFSVGTSQLEDMDIFVLLCQKAENYYAIPRKTMKEYSTSWFSQTHFRFHFRLDTKSHEYIAHKKQPIGSYYQNKEAFFSLSTDF